MERITNKEKRMLKIKRIRLLVIVIGLLLPFVTVINLKAQDAPIKWKEALRQDDEWYSNDEAVRIADNVLIYQHKTGGWPKNIEMAEMMNKNKIEAVIKAKKDDGDDIGRPTIDNGATYSQMKFLASVFVKTGKPRFKEGFLKGIDYLLEAQDDNGGWPQFYPLRKGYYENITFNDGAMMGVMELLRDVLNGEYAFVDSSRLSRVQNALDKGLEVILKTQIEVEGNLTGWCAQYDSQTLKPANARAYELVSISGFESVKILKYLIKIDNPDAEVIQAVTSGIKWFEKTKITTVRLIRKENPELPKGYDLLVGFDPEGAKPLWARFYEIGTNYPVFVDRDGIVKYALSEIDYERRVGYSWLGSWADYLLTKDYPNWAKKTGIKQ
jgi:PelA/Pel-15E family pectate lyase